MSVSATHLVTGLLLLLVQATVCKSGDIVQQDDAHTLYRVSLDDERELVVTRGPDRNPKQALNKGLLGQLGEQSGTMYEVRVEVQFAGKPPLTLASRVRFEEEVGRTDRGTLVLDHNIHQGSLVLALAEGSDVKLWQIDVGRGARVVYFEADRSWTPRAHIPRLDERVIGMTLGRTEDGRLTVEILDKGFGSGFFYEESKADSLNFRARHEVRTQPS